MNKSNLKTIAVVALGLVASSAFAENAADLGVNTYGELVELRTQNSLLAEKLKNVELQQKIREATGTPSAHSKGLPGAAPSIPSTALLTSEVQVGEVSGVGAHLTAKLKLQDGSTVAVSEGSQVPGVGTVTRIRLNEVLVKSGKRTASLPFAKVQKVTGTTNNQGASIAPSSFSMMPPPPPIPAGMN